MDQALLPQLKQAILNDTDPAVVAARAIRNDTELMRLYNLPSTCVVWRVTTPRAEIVSVVNYANMTPVDTPDGTMQWMNRNLQCQSKQINLGNMLIGFGDSLPTGKPNVRQGLQDSLTQLPAGAGGTMLDGGWLGAGRVRLTIQRLATKAERVFIEGVDGTTATPRDLGSFDGFVTIQDIGDAMNLP